MVFDMDFTRRGMLQNWLELSSIMNVHVVIAPDRPAFSMSIPFSVITHFRIWLTTSRLISAIIS